MKNYKIKNSFVSPEGAKARAYKTGIDFMIFFDIRRKLSVIRCYTWLRTGSNPAKSIGFEDMLEK